MGNNLLDKVNQYFLLNDYKRVPTDSEHVVMYSIYAGDNLYLINIIDLEDGYGLDEEGYLEYKQMTMHQLREEEVDKIILLNLILTDDMKELYRSFNYTPDTNEHLIDIQWFINKQKERLVIPRKQVKKVLNIKKELKKIIGKK